MHSVGTVEPAAFAAAMRSWNFVHIAQLTLLHAWKLCGFTPGVQLSGTAAVNSQHLEQRCKLALLREEAEVAYPRQALQPLRVAQQRVKRALLADIRAGAMMTAS